VHSGFEGRKATRSFLQNIICISKLTPDIPCTVDCDVTNNVMYRLAAPNIVLSCFTLINFFTEAVVKLRLVKVVQVRLSVHLS